MRRLCLCTVFRLCVSLGLSCFFFFFNDTATTEIYTLSLHDALPIASPFAMRGSQRSFCSSLPKLRIGRSEEHTSELQSHSDLVCRLLLEKKKKQKTTADTNFPSLRDTNSNQAHVSTSLFDHLVQHAQ